MKLQPFYFFAALILFLSEIYIAIYVNDAFIRPFFGDFLATILVYCFLRMLSVSKAASLGLALGISFGIEFLQYIHFLDWFGLGQFKIIRIILGSSFSWTDIWAYSLGGITAFSLDASKDIRREDDEKPDVIRRVWSDADSVLLIFAGASAEFALSNYVDWLFFTGKIPNQPIDRMMSTLAYAKRLLFTDAEKREIALRELVKIHRQVGEKRGFQIPNEAFLDVLNMLIYYTAKAYELVFGSLTENDRQFIINEFGIIGRGMQIEGLAQNWQEFEEQRELAIKERYSCSTLSQSLFQSYQKNLGFPLYFFLVRVYEFLLPPAIQSGKHRGWIWLISTLLFIKRGFFPLKLFVYFLPSRFQQNYRSLF